MEGGQDLAKTWRSCDEEESKESQDVMRGMKRVW